MKSPILIDTPTAIVFLLKMKKLTKTEENVTATRNHLYYLAKSDQLTRHGKSGRGQALWDLRELAKPYSNSTIVG